MADKRNRIKLAGGLSSPEYDGGTDRLRGKRLPSATLRVGGLRPKPRHRGHADRPCGLGDLGALYGGGLDAAALCS